MDPTTDEAFRSFLPGQQEDDKALIVTFFLDKKLMGLKSMEAGRPIYEDREFVKIQIKGQDKQLVVEEVKPHHKAKYPIAYQQFLERKPAPVVGTPIEQLPGVGPSTVYNLKGLGIRTIEDLAGITDDTVVQSLGMGARQMIGRAQAFLKQTTEKTLSLEEENRQLKTQLGDALGQLKDLGERMAALENSKTGKRKRTEEAPQ